MFTVFTDSLVFALPLPTLMNLQLPKRQRIALTVVFSIGFIVVVAGCFRIYWMWQVVTETYAVTWDGFDLWIWTAVEVNLGVICACTPFLKPLLGGVMDRAGSRKGSKSSRKNSGQNSSGKASRQNSRRISGPSSRKASHQSSRRPSPIMIQPLVTNNLDIRQEKGAVDEKNMDWGKWMSTKIRRMSGASDRRDSNTSRKSSKHKKKRRTDMPRAWEEAGVSPISWN